MKTTRYSENRFQSFKVHGITLSSCIPCPELTTCKNENTDVVVKFGKLNDRIESAESKGVLFQATKHCFLYNFKGIAKYLVTNGNEIKIEREHNASNDEIRLLLYGPVFGALLFQKGFFPLHASAIEINNKVILFAGESGVGKSTLAAAFGKQGYRVLADDMCVATFTENEIPLVHPGIRMSKLWFDTLVKLGENPEKYKKIRTNIEKYNYPLEMGNQDKALPLFRVYNILPRRTSTSIDFNGVSIPAKIQAFINNTYRRCFIVGSEQKKCHFLHCARLAKSVEVRQLYRPDEPFLLQELVNAVQQDLAI